MAAAIIGFEQAIPYWLSAPIIGLVITVVGLVLVAEGANTLRQEDPAPRGTVETLKEDSQWLKNQTR